MSSAEQILRTLFEAALGAADPRKVVADYLPEPPRGRMIVVGAGKASASMAAAVEEAWDGPLEGLIITRYDHGCPTKTLRIVEAAHPVPDEAGRRATAELMALVESAGPDDLVLFLISGGGSSLLNAASGGITFEEKQAVNKALLTCGANITEMNCVRKHLSDVKGGKLAALAAPAQVVTLLISDVPGDDPGTIASGPTVPDESTRHEALAVIERYGVEVSDAVRAHLESDACETPKPDDPIFEGNRVSMIATPQMSLEAAAEKARELGIEPHILSDCIEGEASEVAEVLGAIALQVAERDQPFRAPCVILSGGETTVTVRGKGRGGRNVEFMLSLACMLDGALGIHAIACDTDGVDGLEEIAGAVFGPDILARAEASGLNARAMLDDNDGHSFFEALHAQVITGPTLTNVNDFRAILVERRA